MVSEGLHAADDDYGIRRRITCCRLLNMASEGLHAADVEIWCQKGYMLQMMKYGVRRRITCCRLIWCQMWDYMLQMIKYCVKRRIAGGR